MHTIILITTLPPSYCSIKLYERSSSAVILSQQLQLSVLLHVLLNNGTPTFETEVLCFYTKSTAVKTTLTTIGMSNTALPWPL